MFVRQRRKKNTHPKSTCLQIFTHELGALLAMQSMVGVRKHTHTLKANPLGYAETDG